MNDWHYILFYVRCYFFIFQFPRVFGKFSAVNVLSVSEISCVVYETIFKCSFWKILEMAEWTILLCVGVFWCFYFYFCFSYSYSILGFHWSHCHLSIFRTGFWIYQIPLLMTNFLVNLLLMDFGSCFNIWGGWFELIPLYIGSLFGLLNGR